MVETWFLSFAILVFFFSFFLGDESDMTLDHSLRFVSFCSFVDCVYLFLPHFPGPFLNTCYRRG